MRATACRHLLPCPRCLLLPPPLQVVLPLVPVLRQGESQHQPLLQAHNMKPMLDLQP